AALARRHAARDGAERGPRWQARPTACAGDGGARAGDRGGASRRRPRTAHRRSRSARSRAHVARDDRMNLDRRVDNVERLLSERGISREMAKDGERWIVETAAPYAWLWDLPLE